METAVTPLGPILKRANEHPNFNSVCGDLAKQVKQMRAGRECESMWSECV